MAIDRLRSLLFAPAVRPEMLAKLPGTGADGVVIDCEDATPPGAKEEAREHARRIAPEIAGRGSLVFVRVNAVEGIGRMRLESARTLLLELLRGDESALVRVAAVRTLRRLPAHEPTRVALRHAAENDAAESVRAATSAGDFPPAKRSDWREFHVVDPDNGDSAVKQEAYFAAGADGLVTAFYTDSRGYAGEEAFPPGAYVVGPKTARERY